MVILVIAAVAVTCIVVAGAIEVQATLRNAMDVQENEDKIISILTRLASAETQSK